MILASPLSRFADLIYSRWCDFLRSFETKERLPDDVIIDVGDSTVAVFGMGRVGTGAYETLQKRFGEKVIGIDAGGTLRRHIRQVNRRNPIPYRDGHERNLRKY